MHPMISPTVPLTSVFIKVLKQNYVMPTPSILVVIGPLWAVKTKRWPQVKARFETTHSGRSAKKSARASSNSGASAKKSACASSNSAHIHIRKDTLILCLRKHTRTLAHTYIHTSVHTHLPRHTSEHTLAYGNARKHSSEKHTYSHVHILSPIRIFLRERERGRKRERERERERER